MRDNEKEDARKRGGADKQKGVHSRYQFFRCGKIGGGADKRWGALWRYSTVYAHCSCFRFGIVRCDVPWRCILPCVPGRKRHDNHR